MIRKAVHEKLQDIIADPDKGLELTDEIQVQFVGVRTSPQTYAGCYPQLV